MSNINKALIILSISSILSLGACDNEASTVEELKTDKDKMDYAIKKCQGNMAAVKDKSDKYHELCVNYYEINWGKEAADKYRQ